MSYSDISANNKASNDSSDEYQPGGFSEKSLVTSTPIHSTHSLSQVNRKTATVSCTDTHNSTFSVKENSLLKDTASTEWERWILKKASEQSFQEAEKRRKEKEQRKKEREEKKMKKEKLKQQDKVVQDWIEKKTQAELEKKRQDRERKRELEEKEKTKREEVLNKSIVVVKEWRKKKLQVIKKSEAEKQAEAEKLKLQKVENKLKAQVKYMEWLKKHKPPPTPPRNKPKTLSDIYGGGGVSPGYKNPKAWDSETEVQHEQSRIYYTTFG